jgi:hypothetical protein
MGTNDMMIHGGRRRGRGDFLGVFPGTGVLVGRMTCFVWLVVSNNSEWFRLGSAVCRVTVSLHSTFARLLEPKSDTVRVIFDSTPLIAHHVSVLVCLFL